MRSIVFENEEAWKEARLGRVTGTRLKDLINKRATKPKKGFYEIIAERVALPADDEMPMLRGKRLEDYAIERFEQETGKKVVHDKVLWEREDNPDIAISPDGVISDTEAVEIKCLNTAAHIEAFMTLEIPEEYHYQYLQYFCVNDALQTLYFVFFDPRMPKHEFFYITITRMMVEAEIEVALQTQREALEEIKKAEMLFTF